MNTSAEVVRGRENVAAAQLVNSFTGWLKKFSPDKTVRMKDLFRQVDHHLVIDLGVARALTIKGVRADGIVPLMTMFGLDSKEDVAEIVGLSGVTLWRWSKEKKVLPEIYTEQIIRAMELQILAADVFGSVEAAQKWLNKLHPSLDGESPMAYASNEYGAQKVRGILTALRFGGAA